MNYEFNPKPDKPEPMRVYVSTGWESIILPTAIGKKAFIRMKTERERKNIFRNTSQRR
ncbi:MAG: hypothetical protein LBR10_04350 [Prevotellaceae bacterium]|jgi:hypothetical protein|nr:hypothetical protein [Prevotellaceae bacterium]